MSFAIVTPTYAPDFDRCRFLIESSQRFLRTSAIHYLVISKSDFPVFKTLVSDNVKLIVKEEVLPRRYVQLPFLIKNKSVWIDIKGRIIRGWIIQQIIKLSASNFTTEKNIIFMDSDEFFIRDTHLNDFFIKNNRLRLFRSNIPCLSLWASTISKLLGLELSVCQKCSYVGHPVTWDSDILCRLHSYLSFRHGDYWPFVITKHWHFSEYQLYGVFSEYLTDTSRYHYISEKEVSLMHKWSSNYRPSILQSNDLKKFFDQDEGFNFAMVSSASKTPVNVYEEYVRDRYFY